MNVIFICASLTFATDVTFAVFFAMCNYLLELQVIPSSLWFFKLSVKWHGRTVISTFVLYYYKIITFHHSYVEKNFMYICGSFDC